MKVVVTFDLDEKNLDDLVVMAKVYRKKDGYKEFVSVENNLPLRPLPQERTHGDMEEIVWDNDAEQVYNLGFNRCLHEITGGIEWKQ